MVNAGTESFGAERKVENTTSKCEINDKRK